MHTYMHTSIPTRHTYIYVGFKEPQNKNTGHKDIAYRNLTGNLTKPCGNHGHIKMSASIPKSLCTGQRLFLTNPTPGKT